MQVTLKLWRLTMNLELLQLVPQTLGDLSKNSVASIDKQADSLLEFSGEGEFLLQLEQEFNLSEQKVIEQKLPENGKNLPAVESANGNLSLAVELEQETPDSFDPFRSDEFPNSNATLIPALLFPVQPVTPLPLDINKAASQQSDQLNRSINVQIETSELLTEEIDTYFSDEEVTEVVTSEFIQPELSRKNQIPLDASSGDVKLSRGDAALAMSSVTSPLSPASKAVESTPTLNATLESSVSDYDAWGAELNNRIAWMVRKDIQVVSLRLNPAELGPVEVRIQMKNDQVDVLFNATHAQVREAIEVAVPRLRDMFSEQLLRLDNVNISQHAFEDKKERSKGHEEEFLADGERPADEPEDESMSVSNSAMIAHGQIDYFV